MSDGGSLKKKKSIVGLFFIKEINERYLDEISYYIRKNIPLKDYDKKRRNQTKSLNHKFLMIEEKSRKLLNNTLKT